MNKLPPCDHDCCPPTHCELDRLKAENARLRELWELVRSRRKWRLIPRVSYTNFRKLYPQSQGFKRWLVAERFWRKRLWVIGIRHHIVKIDWRRDWVRDMFESELDLESLMPKSQHNDILDMVRRTEVEPLKAENARLAAANHELFDELRRHVEECDCKLTPHFSSTAANALRDLLGPVEASLNEMREACAAFARVLAVNNLVDAGRIEAEKAGVKDGFGVRSQEQLARLRAAIGEK